MTPIKLNIKGRFMQNRTRRGAVWSLLIGAALVGCTQDLNITNPNAPDTSNFWRSKDAGSDLLTTFGPTKE